MDLRGVRSLKTKWVQNISPEVMNSVFPKANFFLEYPVEIIVITSMNFPTLPYDHVTNSFLLEICFWVPTYPTFLYDVTLFSLFFF